MVTKAPYRNTRESLNQQLHLRELVTHIKRHESRYGVESSSVPAAIDCGELVETHEVCRWLIDYDLLKRMSAYKPPPA